ncbi:MAG TPA: dephospho-CoA kinase [Acidimicrobiia bacterium]
MSRVAWQLGGGIGSGKSTVRRMLEEQGVHAIDADSIGHDVIAPDGPAFAAVAERWPEVVVDGRVDRAALAATVFGDKAELEELEAITHPHIFGRIASRLQELSGVVIVEIPLLDRPAFEAMPRLVVDCADEVRLQRLIERGMTPDDARTRMSIQPSRAAWLAHADLVIPNHDDLESLWTVVQRTVPLLERVSADYTV